MSSYFFSINNELYDYKETSNHLISNRESYSSNIRVYTQPIGLSSTFEYEMIRTNYTNDILVTSSISNSNELKELFKMVDREEALEEMISRIRKSKFKTELLESVENGVLKDSKENRIALLASRFLLSVKKGKQHKKWLT